MKLEQVWIYLSFAVIITKIQISTYSVKKEKNTQTNPHFITDKT